MEHLDRYRMYGLVPYNISPIQQGIQFGHALQEYNNMLSEESNHRVTTFTEAEQFFKVQKEFDDWRFTDKTFIILNGGTSVTMEQHVKTLEDNGIYVGVFREPDLNNMVSGVVFLVPEQVYKRDEWPDFKTWMIKRNPTNHELKKLDVETLKESLQDSYKEWVNMLGGQKNAFLKEFTSQFRLA